MYVSMKRRGHYKKRFLCFVVFLTWCWLMPLSALADTEAVGEVVSFRGIVRIEREGNSWQVEVGEAVHPKDRLQTEADSRVEIVFVDASRVRIAPDSTLEITEYLYQPSEKKRKSLLSLWAGKARFIVSDLVDFMQKGFVVQTPNGTAGVRGTDFIVRVREVRPEQIVLTGGDSYDLQQVLDEVRRLNKRQAVAGSKQ